MLLAHLDMLHDDLLQAKACGDEMLIWTFEREIESVEALLGEIEVMEGQNNV